MTASNSWRKSTLCSKIAKDVCVLCSWCFLLEVFPTQESAVLSMEVSVALLLTYNNATIYLS